MKSLSERELKSFAAIAYEATGIQIPEHKLELMNNRLGRRVKTLGMSSYEEYLFYLKHNQDTELPAFIESITTNETFFFRCPKHFSLLTKTIFPELKSDTINVWSAACSSGEEPYSVAISFLEKFSDVFNRKINIYASDIDLGILKKASDGIYSSYALRLVPDKILKKYFRPVGNNQFVVNSNVRGMVRLGQHNLKDPFPWGKMDLIFCRNVLIYFDQHSKQCVFQNLFGSLKQGGVLFLGESEVVPQVSGFRRLGVSIVQKTSG